MQFAGARSVALVAAALMVGVIAGCGGSDDETTQTVSVTAPATTASTTASTTTGSETSTTTDGGEGAPAPILAAAAVLTTHSTPERACGSYVTENFIETAYGGKENCITARESDELAKRIKVDQSAPQTESRLVVIPDGGPYDGAKVEVDIVQDGSAYRVDGLTADVPAGP
jgi:hypothetical protein